MPRATINYVEMHDAVGDSKFHLCKKIEWPPEARHTRHFISRYAMVMLHRIPYQPGENVVI